MHTTHLDGGANGNFDSAVHRESFVVRATMGLDMQPGIGAGKEDAAVVQRNRHRIRESAHCICKKLGCFEWLALVENIHAVP